MRVAQLLFVSLFSLLATTATVGGQLGSPTTLSTSVFYFHYVSELYHNENDSITVLEEANPNLPVGPTPQVVSVAAAIRNVTTIFGSVWIGTVAWVSQPCAEPTAIHGAVVFSAWLSSGDATPTFSGIGVGIAVLDEKNQTVGDYVYNYSYARGNVLTNAPRRYEFQVEVNREISADERLVFAVGAGSTTPGWKMQIYYDSTQYPSLAQLPSLIMVVAELPQNSTEVATVVLIVVSLSLIQRRRILQKPH